MSWSLLETDLNSHWYAIEDGQLTSIEKDSKPVRALKTIIGTFTTRNYYSHIRYENILTTIFETIQNEKSTPVIARYIQIIQKLKSKKNLSLCPQEEAIIDKYNTLTVSSEEENPIGYSFQEELSGSFLSFSRIKAAQNIRFRVEKALRGEGSISYRQSQTNHLVFTLPEFSELIFKIKREDKTTEKQGPSMKKLLEKTKKAREICKKSELTKIIIPSSIIMKIHAFGTICDLLVEEKIQRQWCHISEHEAPEIVRQLAIMILQSGLSSIKKEDIQFISRNMTTKVALLNLKKMNSPYSGLFEKNGLLDLFGEEYTPIVLKEINKRSSCRNRSFVLPESKSFLFDNFTNWKPQLFDLANCLFQKISLKKELDHSSSKKLFFIDTSQGIFEEADNTYLTKHNQPWQFPSQEQYFDSKLLGVVINTFIDLGIIKGIHCHDYNGYWLTL